MPGRIELRRNYMLITRYRLPVHRTSSREAVRGLNGHRGPFPAAQAPGRRERAIEVTRQAAGLRTVRSPGPSEARPRHPGRSEATERPAPYWRVT